MNIVFWLASLLVSPVAEGGWCSSNSRQHRWAVVRYGGATVDTAKSSVPTPTPKKIKKKKKVVKDENLPSPKPAKTAPISTAGDEKEEIIVHEVIASVKEKSDDETGSILWLSTETAQRLDWPGSTTMARVHGPRRRWTIVRVRIGGSENILSIEAAENLGISSFGKLLVVPTKSIPIATKVAIVSVGETVTEEDEDVLFEEEITPYFGAKIPIKVNDIFITGTKKFKVKALENVRKEKYGLIDPAETSIVIDYEEVVSDDEDSFEESSKYRYEELGGCEEHTEALREVVELPLHSPEIFARLGVDPPKGALIFGPSGCGKSQLIRAAAYESGVHVEILAGAEIAARKTGEAEEALRAAFQRAESHAPAVIVIDDVDLIAKKRDKAANEQEKRLTSQLLTLMDGLRPSTGVVVLTATAKPNELDPAARRFGRLDREIELVVPDEDQRLDILKVKTRGVRLGSDVDLRMIAKDCHGFVGADLAQLCTEAALACVKDNLLRAADTALLILDDDEDALLEEASIETAAASVLRRELQAEISDVLTVTADHFARALKTCNPSSLRESVVEVPDVSWNDVGGLEEVKRELRETVEYPVQFASLYADFGLPPSKGVLFYGPPGCGKTLIAKAVANECGANFISVKGPELLTMWFGESEANVRNLFDKARAAAPCVLFFDEMDSIAKARSSSASGSDAGDRVMNQILAEIDAVGAKNVFVVGATNRPDILDPAVTRPGRLDQLVHIPLPDLESRKSVFKASLRKAPVDPAVDIDQLAQATIGFSGADISEICQRAAKNAVKAAVEAPEGTSVDMISRAHFEEAMSRARRSVPDSEIQRYKKFTDSLKTSAKADANMKFDFDRGFISTSSPPTPTIEAAAKTNNNDSINPALF